MNENKQLSLWGERVPGALGSGAGHSPSLSEFPVYEGDARAAMLILPGGCYRILAPHEGEGYARWLNTQGIHAFVLNYRLGTAGYRHPIMLNDAKRAMRLLRQEARNWGIEPNGIGVMGSSAGGHLAATLLTQWDLGDPQAVDPVERQSCRPSLGVLCYPVISLEGPFAHQGSRDALLGENAPDALAADLSAERNVREDTPPCFLWHTVEDAAVPVENSLAFAAALRRACVPFDLHVYSDGPHGLGLSNQPGEPDLPWTTDLVAWFGRMGFRAS